ncbi:MAG: MaoC/PaaZ C-terminal domain-containing protein [Sorangiineae bacterium]|nr:MaoC/PaaZ C-terminal domain-containing protein [Polyangiaceae bacterium]MEB2323680.1 MaoC/PaaZ C-terminal domain-containing protein [Sorangiineae bacterium]
MTVSITRLFEQGPVLRTLAGVAAASLTAKPRASAPPALPGPWLEMTLPPRSPELLRDFIRFSGGDPSWYRGRVPAHLFPQWGFPLAARAMSSLSYPMQRVMNAGCRLEQRAPLPANEPLLIRARLERLDDDGRRALITTRIETGTRSAPGAVIAHMNAFVPLGRGSAPDQPRPGPRPKKELPTVPVAARELAFVRFGAKAGWEFAKLTGDLNPIHWIPPAARASGFRSVILHGFATLSRALEALNRGVFAGDVSALASVEVRFTKPLVLPRAVGVYATAASELFVGDAPGGAAYLQGTFERQSS